MDSSVDVRRLVADENPWDNSVGGVGGVDIALAVCRQTTIIRYSLCRLGAALDGNALNERREVTLSNIVRIAPRDQTASPIDRSLR